MELGARRAAVVGALVVGMGVIVAGASAQVPGQNINMVAGTEWPGGDPFLQRQNEPSLAVSSRNPLHLLAGANDYRTVDIPAADLVPGALAGDAWLGLFKSLDGGRTWQSTLLPGFPQDDSPAGLASPLRGFTTGADPTVRAGTNGLFFYSGIAFNRGTNEGAVFVARFIDLNNKENGDVTLDGDPIRYISTEGVDDGTAGQFLDKPWIAVDVPRSGAEMCTIDVPATGSFPATTQSFPAGNVYLVYSRFTGSQSTKIMLTRSVDCGRTWSHPTKLSESNSVNQGTILAIDPATGTVYAVWRRFATSSQSDAILFASSGDFGKTFSKAQEVASILPFDQGTTAFSFRTSALPSLAVSVDALGQSHIHAAWAERFAPDPDQHAVVYARIVVSTSSDGGATWSLPQPVDDQPIYDDFGNAFERGHQVMPQLTFSGGKLMALYYDLRLDHTVGRFTPNQPFEADPGSGEFYRERREPRGELPDDPAAVFTPFVSDGNLALRRHTIDLRVAQADPGPAPSFVSAPVSRYNFGTRPDRPDTFVELEQLQVNPPNLPLFQQGTLPFLGDYIDIAGPSFVAEPDGSWRFATESDSAVHYATWTSNQDVRPPFDGDWTNYTPVGGGGASIYDPSQTTPACIPGQEGTRNQNIYMSRISQGLAVESPQNAKPLSPTLERAFVVTVQNATRFDRSFRLSIANQPMDGRASFIPASSEASCPAPPSDVSDPSRCTALDVEIGARSGVARSVFALSSHPTARIVVNVDEVAGLGGSPIAGGLSGFVVLNADPTTPPLVNPDGAIQDIATAETYDPAISFVNISNPNTAETPDVNISNVNISNPDLSDVNISNVNISNPDLADVNISNVNISNVNISNVNISNVNISNVNISNEPISDATYAVTNTGNTWHSYHVKLVGEAPTDETPLQLILSRPYQTPVGLDCELAFDTQTVLLANIDQPLVNQPDSLADPNIPDERASNATLALAPGQTALITLRGGTALANMAAIASEIAPVVVAHGSAGASFAAALLVTSDSAGLPLATVGVPYSAPLEAIGGATPYGWVLIAGSLPTGLQLDPSGSVSGTPTTAGSFQALIEVTDASDPSQSNTKTLSFEVAPRATSMSVEIPGSVVVGQRLPVTVTLSDVDAGTTEPPAGVLSVTDQTSALLGTCELAPISPTAASCSVDVAFQTTGPHLLSVSYSGNSIHAESETSPSLTVAKAATVTTVTTTPNPSLLGAPVLVTVDVAVAPPGAGTPTGDVTVSDGTLSCTAPLNAASGTCSLEFFGAGARTLTASFAGDDNFEASEDSTVHVVSQGVTATLITSDAPDPSVVGQPLIIGISVSAPAGVPTGTVTVTAGSQTCSTVLLGGNGSCSVTFATAGAKTLTASYSGDADFAPSAGVASHQVDRADTATTITAHLPDPSRLGEAVTVDVNVAAVPPGAGTPSGSVSVSDGSVSCDAALSGGSGSCSLTPASGGTTALTATYSGDARFNPSAATVSHEVQSPYVFDGFFTPLTTAGSLEAPTTSGNFNLGRAVPIKWQIQDASGATVQSLDATAELRVVFEPGNSCRGPVPASGTSLVLFSPSAGTTGGSDFRFDINGNQFVFNWDTSTGVATGPGCYAIILQLDDASPAKATWIRLR